MSSFKIIHEILCYACGKQVRTIKSNGEISSEYYAASLCWDCKDKKVICKFCQNNLHDMCKARSCDCFHKFAKKETCTCCGKTMYNESMKVGEDNLFCSRCFDNYILWRLKNEKNIDVDDETKYRLSMGWLSIRR